jgi:hypothetical protein
MPRILKSIETSLIQFKKPKPAAEMQFPQKRRQTASTDNQNLPQKSIRSAPQQNDGKITTPESAPQ